MITESRHADPIAPNPLTDLAIQRTDQVWATDATHVITAQGWLYVVAPQPAYQRRLRQFLSQHGLLASMSRRANCYDNAFIESFWSGLKYEAVYGRRFATRAEARTAIFDYIEGFYNRHRLHSSLGYLSPISFESQINYSSLPHCPRNRGNLTVDTPLVGAHTGKRNPGPFPHTRVLLPAAMRRARAQAPFSILKTPA